MFASHKIPAHYKQTETARYWEWADLGPFALPYNCAEVAMPWPVFTWDTGLFMQLAVVKSEVMFAGMPHGVQQGTLTLFIPFYKSGSLYAWGLPCCTPGTCGLCLALHFAWKFRELCPHAHCYADTPENTCVVSNKVFFFADPGMVWIL